MGLFLSCRNINITLYIHAVSDLKRKYIAGRVFALYQLNVTLKLTSWVRLSKNYQTRSTLRADLLDRGRSLLPYCPNVKVLSLGSERLTPKVLDQYLHHNLVMLPLLFCFVLIYSFQNTQITTKI